MVRQVLIIDDNVSDSNAIKRHLSGLRAEIYQALRLGMAKEDLIKFNKGDIVICDFKLPDGNAVELMEWLDKKNIGCSVFVNGCGCSGVVSCRSKRLYKQASYSGTASAKDKGVVCEERSQQFSIAVFSQKRRMPACI